MMTELLFGTTAIVVIQDRPTLSEYCNRVYHVLNDVGLWEGGDEQRVVLGGGRT